MFFGCETSPQEILTFVKNMSISSIDDVEDERLVQIDMFHRPRCNDVASARGSKRQTSQPPLCSVAFLQFWRHALYILSSDSEMSPRVCNDFWKVFVDVISKSCQEVYNGCCVSSPFFCAMYFLIMQMLWGTQRVAHHAERTNKKCTSRCACNGFREEDTCAKRCPTDLSEDP